MHVLNLDNCCPQLGYIYNCLCIINYKKSYLKHFTLFFFP